MRSLTNCRRCDYCSWFDNSDLSEGKGAFHCVQVVLISVIQQLGVDLKNEVVRCVPSVHEGFLSSYVCLTIFLFVSKDVKFEWLQEAVLHVERDDTNIAAHIPQVVEAVEQSLKVSPLSNTRCAAAVPTLAANLQLQLVGCS